MNSVTGTNSPAVPFVRCSFRTAASDQYMGWPHSGQSCAARSPMTGMVAWYRRERAPSPADERNPPRTFDVGRPITRQTNTRSAKLNASEFRRGCDPAQLPFTTTAELPDSPLVFRQDRAVADSVRHRHTPGWLQHLGARPHQRGKIRSRARVSRRTGGFRATCTGLVLHLQLRAASSAAGNTTRSAGRLSARCRSASRKAPTGTAPRPNALQWLGEVSVCSIGMATTNFTRGVRGVARPGQGRASGLCR